MPKQRDIEQSGRRVLAALEAHPEWDLKDIAKLAGISRMHLYRLACRFPEVGKAYKFALQIKDWEAEETASGAAFGHPCDLHWLNRVIHRGMKNRYYLSRWERREAGPIIASRGSKDIPRS